MEKGNIDVSITHEKSITWNFLSKTSSTVFGRSYAVQNTSTPSTSEARRTAIQRTGQVLTLEFIVAAAAALLLLPPNPP
jgi:hypothetical protein